MASPDDAPPAEDHSSLFAAIGATLHTVALALVEHHGAESPFVRSLVAQLEQQIDWFEHGGPMSPPDPAAAVHLRSTLQLVTSLAGGGLRPDLASH